MGSCGSVIQKKHQKSILQISDRDHGWKALNDLEFYGIRIVNIDEDWSALRFRNIKYIKSTSEKFYREENLEKEGDD